MKGPKIVITGGLGFIFSYVTEHFVKKGWEVVVIDNLSEGSHPEIVDGSFVHHNLHMASPEVIQIIVDENPDYVIHAAAITDVDYSIREPLRTLMKNALGTIHAFEACRNLPNLKKFMYVATDEVYGECEGADHPMHERDVLLPRSPYSASKAFGSLINVAYENTYPTLKGKVVETRMSNIFGARQDVTKILPQIKKSLETGYSIPLHNGGEGYRQYLYVKNIPSSVELLLKEGEGVYNVTASVGYTVNELIQKAEEITGKKVTTHTASRPGMDRRYEMDGSRIRALGWREEYSFEDGLRDYLEYGKKNEKPLPPPRRSLASGALSFLARSVSRSPRMTVLLYHSISSVADSFAVTPTEFERQMKYVKEHFDVVPLSRAVAHARGERVTRDSVAITFDDGYKDFVTNAMLTLKKYHIPATVFVLGDKVDRKELGNNHALLTAADGSTLTDPLVTVGSHGLTHRKLTRISAEELQEELLGSRNYIQETFGTLPKYLAYPKGSHNEKVMAAAESAGYEAGVTVIQRGVRAGDNLFALPRIQIDGRTSFRRFQMKLTIVADWYYALWKLAN